MNMSALGHKRTCAVHQAMSAFAPKADICALTHVRFGPKADMCNAPDDVRFRPEADITSLHGGVDWQRPSPME
jgi:hypothetical protein